MQQVQARQLNSNTDSVQYVWQNDEEAFVDALMGMAQESPHESLGEDKDGGYGPVERDRDGPCVRTLSRPLDPAFRMRRRALARLYLFSR